MSTELRKSDEITKSNDVSQPAKIRKSIITRIAEHSKKHMSCKEVEKLIPLFQDDSLTNKELQQFMSHLEHCSECQEEVAIYCLINEGMLRLEDGNVFDLQESMDNSLERARARLRRRQGMQVIVYSLEGLVGAAIVIILALITIR